MNTEEYCRFVQQEHRLRKQRMPTMKIREDGSPLISLLESGFELIFEPSINRDYKYFVRATVFDKIGRISRLLSERKMKLIIRSAWRSFEHQQLLWDRNFEIARIQNPDSSLHEIEEIVLEFTASRERSMHATGGAVDALIYDSESDSVMDFGNNNGYKIDLNMKCFPLHPEISSEAKRNRRLLLSLFEDEGFVCDLTEYWHFDYGNVAWAIAKGKEHAIYGIIKHATPPPRRCSA